MNSSPDKDNPWKPVSFAADCLGGDDQEHGDQCSVCLGQYAECECPGPTQDGYEYEEIDGVLCARRIEHSVCARCGGGGSYFSRVEPMGYYCVRCVFDEFYGPEPEQEPEPEPEPMDTIDTFDFKEAYLQLTRHLIEFCDGEDTHEAALVRLIARYYDLKGQNAWYEYEELCEKEGQP